MTNLYMTDHQRLTEATELLSNLESAIHDQEQNLKNLEAAGVIRAGIWWKDGKYLYVVHPRYQGDNRRREYIGADPEKVKTTLDAIERAKQHDSGKERLRQLNAKLDRFRYFMSMVRDALE